MHRIFAPFIWVPLLLPLSSFSFSEAAFSRRGLRYTGSEHVISSGVGTSSSRLASTLESEDAAFDDFLEEWFSDFAVRKPMEALRFGRQLVSCRGLSQQNTVRVSNIWGNSSAAAEMDGVREDERWLQRMHERFDASIGSRSLSDERHVSFAIMQMKVKEMQQENHFSAFRPPFGPLGCQIGIMGCQVQAAGMLRGFQITNADDAKCYVALMHGLKDFLHGHGERLQKAAASGVVQYRFVLDAVVKDCNEMLPEDTGAARSTEFFQLFQTKLQNVKGLSATESDALLSEAEVAIKDGFWGAYRDLRSLVSELLPRAAGNERGISSIYGNEARNFYAYRVQLLGVGSDAHSLHKHALEQVAENVEEIKHSVQKAQNVKQNASMVHVEPSTLEVLLTQSHYSNTEEGRASYINEAKADISDIWKKLRESASSGNGRLFFHSEIPDLPCSVQRVRSKSFPGVAQYSSGSVGQVNRSATLALNVNDMSRVSTLELESLCHHEVVPGHHLQVTKTLNLPLPSFRRFFGDEAFAEGWAVYAEQELSPRLINLSASSNVGRLRMRQFKFVRMGVDIGLHYLDWDRKKAERFYMEQAMMSSDRASQAVDRHLAWPAQALTYAAGYEEMKRIRHSIASDPQLVKKLGKDWEAMMHKAILTHGDMPLALLKNVVFAQLNAWSLSG